ncbi:hypothetical protein C482_05646 [Natrialba chahannaoensis JCM 10990]|uniref:Peptidase C-terminal archaeal/bacterial domain-containing protein n=1 Tax=Natrialba chahannaoensis JCM 10990 TaxID=1227492 RepID=M0AUS0_9EURY|nr:hypothetical protein [Natrialba chahannaoensis]ELZ02057.1 hypothetical protein C482_05646 [Natrialba chahannaoensis JCM 10990]
MQRRTYLQTISVCGTLLLIGCNQGHEEPVEEFVTPSNTSLENPDPLQGYTYGDFSIEEDGDHYFSIDLDEGETVTASLQYTYDDGPLSLILRRQDGSILDRSETQGDGETVSMTAAEPDSYILNVSSMATNTNTYTIDIDIE